MIVGSIAVHWLVRAASPRLFRRLDPATAGTLGFLIRLFAMSIVVILALRVAGIKASTLALGTVSSLGLFYTTLAQGADRIQIPNSVMINLAVAPLREPARVDRRALFAGEESPRRVEQRLLETVDTPTRYAPSVASRKSTKRGSY